MAATNYDPTIIAIEIIQSLQSQQTEQPQSAPAQPSIPTPPTQNAVPAASPTVSQTQSPAATQTVATVSAQTSLDSASPMNDVGPFGWVGIGFLFCLLFALIINIYLKKQKKEMDVQPTKEELEKFAPGAMEEQAQSS